MYTTLQLLQDDVNSRSVRALVEQINAEAAGAQAGERHRGDGVSCEVCRSDRWSDHTDRITWFVGVLGSVLRQAALAGFNVKFDLAVEPEDGVGKLAILLGFQPQLLEALAAAHAGLEITVYCGAEPENDEPLQDDPHQG